MSRITKGYISPTAIALSIEVTADFSSSATETSSFNLASSSTMVRRLVALLSTNSTRMFLSSIDSEDLGLVTSGAGSNMALKWNVLPDPTSLST